MADDRTILRYFIVSTSDPARPLTALDVGLFEKLLVDALAVALKSLAFIDAAIAAILKTAEIRPIPPPPDLSAFAPDGVAQPHPPVVVVPYQFALNTDDARLEQVIGALGRAWAITIGPAFLGDGADVVLGPSDHWCPGGAGNPTFGTRADADRLIGLDRLPAQPDGRQRGEGTFVVVVGMQLPGQTDPGDIFDGNPHTQMIIRNVAHIAPGARLLPLNIVPAKIDDLDSFLSTAELYYRVIFALITTNWLFNGLRGVFVNSWNVYDRRIESPPGAYTANPCHPFNQIILRGITDFGFDFAFSAGNCGQFCPDGRCGPDDIGPGASIHGANSLAEVVTVGAVRADTLWLGYSSQGPGVPRLGREKPDLCAPSQFTEDDDAALLNVGTSAASGVMAGAMAALRGYPRNFTGSPDTLRQHLCDTAYRPDSPGRDNRLGAGILDLHAAWTTPVA